MPHTVGVFASLMEEDGRMVLVRQSYAGRCWTQPGGRLEPGEDPVAGVLREALEEAMVEAQVTAFVGTYVMPARNDVVLHFRGRVVARHDWRPSDEIVACASFRPDELPSPMRLHTQARVLDGFSGASGLFRVWDAAGRVTSL